MHTTQSTQTYYFAADKSRRGNVIVWLAIAATVVLSCGIVVLLVLFLDFPTVPGTIASTPCSGYGVMENDYVGTSSTCSCFPCRTGVDCSVVVDDCIVDLRLGQPSLLQLYWQDNSQPTVSIPPTYKTLYDDSLPNIIETIQNLHSAVGNAVVSNATIVLGYNADQLIGAALYAMNYGSPPKGVFSQSPYSPYSNIVSVNPLLGTWNDSLHQPVNNVIEIVTSPSDTDGNLRNPFYSLSTNSLIYDLRYYWPSYTNVERNTTAKNVGVVLVFDAAEATGHAGNRFGWALVYDSVVADRMNFYINSTTQAVSTDLQLKMNTILDYVVSAHLNIYPWISSKLLSRYQLLAEALEGQTRFSMQSVSGAYYLWIQCTNVEDCSSVFDDEANVLGYSGTYFGVSAAYVRFNMMSHDEDFNVLCEFISNSATK